MKNYLPSSADLPDGFSEAGTFTFSAPDGISDSGTIDMAMMMAMRGDVTSPDNIAGAEMLMSMVMRPEDLQSLGGALEELKNLDEESLREEFEGAGGGGLPFEFSNFRVLDASDLGDGGAGIEVTMDMGELFDTFGGAFGADAGGVDLDALSTMSMRMYFFGRGNYMGATMHIAFSDTLSAADADLALARAIDAKLLGAP